MEPWEPDPRPLARTLVYECPGYGGPGYDFIARLGPGEMAVWLADRYLILSRVRSASGVKYQEGDVVFWMKGEEAILNLGDEHHVDCRLAPERVPWEDARRRGVDFRAVGNEPGWYLEIQRGKSLRFVGSYGALSLEFDAPTETSGGPVRTYQAFDEENTLRVEIVEGVCSDSMKGESFPSQVIVEVNGTAYQGCGRDLEPLLDQGLGME
jgi:putative lipoprotein